MFAIKNKQTTFYCNPSSTQEILVWTKVLDEPHCNVARQEMLTPAGILNMVKKQIKLGWDPSTHTGCHFWVSLVALTVIYSWLISSCYAVWLYRRIPHLSCFSSLLLILYTNTRLHEKMLLFPLFHPENDNTTSFFPLQFPTCLYTYILCFYSMLFIFPSLHVAVVVCSSMQVPFRDYLHINFVRWGEWGGTRFNKSWNKPSDKPHGEIRENRYPFRYCQPSIL